MAIKIAVLKISATGTDLFKAQEHLSFVSLKLLYSILDCGISTNLAFIIIN